MTDAFSEPALSVCALVSDRFTSLFTFARLPQLYEITLGVCRFTSRNLIRVSARLGKAERGTLHARRLKYDAEGGIVVEII